MASKITLDVLDAQQHCPLKAYYRLNGEAGTKSDFERLICDARQLLPTFAVLLSRIQGTYPAPKQEGVGPCSMIFHSR